MIPEEPFNFNPFGPARGFSDPEVRLPHLFQPGVEPTQETVRHLLAVCPICKRPWYKVGRGEYPCLTAEQLALLGALLQVDTQALYLLPRVICTICSTLHLGGMFSAATYPHHRGYRLLWESASPRRIQLLALVCRGEELTADALVQMAPATLAEPTGEVRSVLSWLALCPCSEAMCAFSREQGQRLARLCPPGSDLDGRGCQWRGYAWETTCAPLGGTVLVLLAVALPTQTLPPFSSLHMGWRVLARAMHAVL